MLTRTNRIVCDACGRFVSYQDLVAGTARHVMTNPDAYGCKETFESLCARCKAKETPALALSGG